MGLDGKHGMSRFGFYIAALTVLAGSTLPAFSDDSALMARSFDQRGALTNSPIIVTATLTNAGTDTLRGFYFTDQLPSAFVVNTVDVILNGESLTNFSLEIAQDGDVYAGYTPWRWRLETPVDLLESNSIFPGAELKIVYSLTSAMNGSFVLQPYDWVTYFSDPTNAVFGFSQDPCEGTVRFVDSTDIPLISAQYGTNGYSLSLDGAPCTSYVLYISSNLYDWLPLMTNTSPFTFVETNTDLPQRFYRAAPLP
jgi:uncharacterized repeat protein (TIGR01451 family)